MTEKKFQIMNSIGAVTLLVTGVHIFTIWVFGEQFLKRKFSGTITEQIVLFSMIFMWLGVPKKFGKAESIFLWTVVALSSAVVIFMFLAPELMLILLAEKKVLAAIFLFGIFAPVLWIYLVVRFFRSERA